MEDLATSWNWEFRRTRDQSCSRCFDRADPDRSVAQSLLAGKVIMADAAVIGEDPLTPGPSLPRTPLMSSYSLEKE